MQVIADIAGTELELPIRDMEQIPKQGEVVCLVYHPRSVFVRVQARTHLVGLDHGVHLVLLRLRGVEDPAYATLLRDMILTAAVISAATVAVMPGQAATPSAGLACAALGAFAAATAALVARVVRRSARGTGVPRVRLDQAA